MDHGAADQFAPEDLDAFLSRLLDGMSVLVDVEEVRALVLGPDHGGFTAIALKDRMQTSDRVTHALMVQGHLKTVTVVNPVNRCPTVIVLPAEVERF